MKILIVYASKYGTTEDCANLLKDKLSGDVTIMNINQATSIDLSLFNTVIIGGSVYVGKISKKLREFCEKNMDSLSRKKLGLFLCCALVENKEQLLSDNFPQTLLKNTTVTGIFGSEARLDKMSFMDKTILKTVTKGDFSAFKISEESIDAFAKEID